MGAISDLSRLQAQQTLESRPRMSPGIPPNNLNVSLESRGLRVSGSSPDRHASRSTGQRAQRRAKQGIHVMSGCATSTNLLDVPKHKAQTFPPHTLSSPGTSSVCSERVGIARKRNGTYTAWDETYIHVHRKARARRTLCRGATPSPTRRSHTATCAKHRSARGVASTASRAAIPRTEHKDSARRPKQLHVRAPE